MTPEELTTLWEGLDAQFAEEFVTALIDEIKVQRMTVRGLIADRVDLEMRFPESRS